MSDGPTTVETLAGDPAGWPAALRDLLRDASEEAVDRGALLAELSAGAADDESAEQRLAFLETVGVLDCAGDGCSPGEVGREYLDTHDETVLYEALSDSVDGFETALEGLAVRPLTDVEIADLLSATLAAEIEPAEAGRYGSWLCALGYLSREDGVNELTRKGRRLVATTDDLTPPGADADRSGRSGPFDSAGSERGRSAGESPEGGGVRQSPAADASGSRDIETDNETDEDTPESLESDLRARYDDTCMVCGERRRRGDDGGYSEIHFLMPLAAPHDGPADPENAVVVCPNHHADFEHGTVTVDPRTLTVGHEYDGSVTGRTLLTADDHEPGAQYLAYHNDVVAGE
jgi:hypothetical protein